MSVNNDQVLNALRGIDDPAGGDVVSSGVVRALNISGGDVKFVMEVDPARAPEYADAKTRAEEVVRSLPGVVSVSVVLTAHSAKAPPDLKPTARPKPQGPENIPGVKHIIAIASGKGGVGKSTVASNIACALAARRRNVGLLDADLYGPSQPRMMGATGRPDSPDGKIITPKLTHGVKMMSIGLMMEEGQSVVWRGPMLMGALQQLLTQVEWGHLDTLIVDLPPGTGDVQLSLAQKTGLGFGDHYLDATHLALKQGTPGRASAASADALSVRPFHLDGDGRGGRGHTRV